MTTTTAQVIIIDALKEIQVVGEGETPTATMLDDGLRMLNRLLDTFSNNSDFAYYASTVTFTLAGAASFTVGPTGDVVSDRPISIETANVDVSGITYPVKVVDNQRYDEITYKALAGAYPACLYYEATYPNGTVYVWPLSTGGTLDMRVINSVKQFAALTTQIDMPQGYEDYLVLALAIRSAPMYGSPVNPDTKIAYLRAKSAIHKTNQLVPTLQLPNAVMGRTGSSYAAFMAGE